MVSLVGQLVSWRRFAKRTRTRPRGKGTEVARIAVAGSTARHFRCWDWKVKRKIEVVGSLGPEVRGVGVRWDAQLKAALWPLWQAPMVPWRCIRRWDKVASRG